MTDAQLIQLWNLLFPDNDSREISEQDLRDGLIAFLNTLSGRIGLLSGLATFSKSSVVNSINECVDRLENLENRFEPQFGEADPNVVPPPSDFDYGSIYVQQQDIGGNIYNIGFWVYTDVQNIGWINLISLIRPVLEGTDNPNTTQPTGFDNDNGTKGALYYQRINATQDVIDLGFWIYVSPTTKWINLMAKEVIYVSGDLPLTGLPATLYLRESDNTLHRFQSASFPPSWVLVGGGEEEGIGYDLPTDQRIPKYDEGLEALVDSKISETSAGVYVDGGIGLSDFDGTPANNTIFSTGNQLKFKDGEGFEWVLNGQIITFQDSESIEFSGDGSPESPYTAKQLHVYSTTEQPLNEFWIDERRIYEIVFQGLSLEEYPDLTTLSINTIVFDQFTKDSSGEFNGELILRYTKSGDAPSAPTKFKYLIIE